MPDPQPAPNTRPGLRPAALDHVRDALAPGGRVVRYRPLHGGVSCSIHLVRLQTRTGSYQDVVVRRYTHSHHGEPADACAREFRMLAELAAHAFPVPRPLLLEAAGGPFGAPTLLMSRLPGRPLLDPPDLAAYVRTLAHTLARLHALPTTALDFLPDQLDLVGPYLAEPYGGPDPLQQEVARAVLAGWPRVAADRTRRTLVHGDYWPGNLLWSRGKLLGVIDWEEPCLGDPAQDVATCRMDLALLFGAGHADAFLAAYEAASGRRLAHLRFWDLNVATWALAEMDGWASSWQALGRGDLGPAQARGRVEAHVRANLARPA
jgi:aminoglycoside phosphotransferase (APT) family kinase protein